MGSITDELRRRNAIMKAKGKLKAEDDDREDDEPDEPEDDGEEESDRDDKDLDQGDDGEIADEDEEGEPDGGGDKAEDDAEEGRDGDDVEADGGERPKRPPTRKSPAKRRGPEPGTAARGNGVATGAKPKPKASGPEAAEVKPPPSRVTGTVEIKLADLSGDDTYRFRTDLRVEPLVKDVRAHGQLVPIVVRKRGKKYQVVCGFRRCAALRRAGAETVVATVTELTDDEALAASWRENAQRKNYSELDRANAIAKARQAGKKLDELEKIFSLTRKQLTRLTQLAEAPSALTAALEAGSIDSSHAVVLNAAKRRHPDLSLGRWVKDIGENRLSVRDLQAAITKQYRGRAEPKPIIEEDDGVVRFRALRVPLRDIKEEEKVPIRDAAQRLLDLLA